MSAASYAQLGEDLRLLRTLGRVRRGTYIDVGAHHPEFHSVTKLFYDRGWSGINIEPVPSSFAALARERTRDVNLCLAASDRAGTAVLHEIVASGLSTLVERHAERHRRAGWERRTHRVETRRLDDICAEHAPRRIHFLKIDAEGSEREILLGCDLVRFRPWIVVIEAKEPLSETPTHGEWEPMLLAARYEFAWSDGLNRFYVARERRRLKRALADPPAGPASRMPHGAFGRMPGLGASARMFGRNRLTASRGSSFRSVPVRARNRRATSAAVAKRAAMEGSLLEIIPWAHGPRRLEWENEIRARARPVPVAGGQILCRILGRYKLYIDDSDVGFGAHIALEGFWESWITQFVIRHMVRDSVVMDIGANHGYYTVVMADLVGPGGKVICFEPYPSTRLLLERNIEINGFSDRAVIDARAVADVSGGHVGMSCPPGEPKNARLDWGGANGTIEVETLALDDLDLIGVDFMKVDIEGAEERMWAGMQRFLDRNPAVRLLLEFNRGRCVAPRRMLDEIAARFPLRHVDPGSQAVHVTADEILSAPPMDWMLYLSVRDPLPDTAPANGTATVPPLRWTRLLRAIGLAR